MQTPQLPIKTDVPFAAETREQRDARMEWWRESRFGMFIHWGLYAIPAGEWMGKKGHGEWIRNSAEIPVEAYDKFLDHFNPYKFDAKKWVSIAKDAGMKYIVITSKHHDGFALFDSKVSNFDVMATPFKRDIIKELADECKKQGIVFCLYHSIMDWHHPDYLPRRPWEVADRPATGADFERFVRYLHAQVSELLTHYGPIGIMWFDGEWESTWSHEYGQALYNLCRTLQPNTIVNNRVDVGRGGSMAGLSGEGYAGDYGTPEQEIPATGIAGMDWETCMTMNNHWGYNRNDKAFKPTRELIRNLVDIASKGGNYLLNVGPTALGEIPEESVQRLKEIGAWMRVNGDSIYGSSPSVFEKTPWGRCTVKRGQGKTMVFLHVFNWPSDGKLTVPGLGSDPKRAFILGGGMVATKRDGPNVVLTVPGSAPSADDTVIGLEFVGEPTVYTAPDIEADADIFVRTLPVKLNANPGLEVRYTLDGSKPTASSEASTGSVVLSETTVVSAQAFHEGKPVTEVVTHKFTKVTPRPAVETALTDAGLRASLYSGIWDRLPDFGKMTATSSFVLSAIDITEPMKGEHIGVRAEGLIQIPADEVYLFELTSDDGARLYIDGTLVVDNDGLHSPEAKSGVIALAAGAHVIRADWFNQTGGTALRLRYATPGHGYNDVPPAWLKHARHE